MNKSQLFTLSGALLASTALAGTASAGTVGRIGASVQANAFATSAISIANTLFSGTTATANAVQFTGSGAAFPIAVSFTNNFAITSLFNVTLNVSGATMNQTNFGHHYLIRTPATPATFLSTYSGCASTTALVDKILLSSCSLTGTTLSAAIGNTAAIDAFNGGILLSGIIFTNASGMATAGTTITLSGEVNDNANPSVVLETITSGTVLTSAAPVTATVTAGASAVTDPTTTPGAFKSFSSPNSGQLSITLATVLITSTGAVGTNLALLVTPDGSGNQAASSSVTITVTSASLTDDATASATLSNTSNTVTLTPAALTSGSGAFSLTAANGYDSNGAADQTQTINVQFDGTHAINAAAAGTVTVAFGTSAATGHVVAPSGGAGGATSSITSGGFQTEFNTALASGGDYQSFLRIHNNGSTAGTVTITVLNEADGTNLGSYTTGTLAVGQTTQVDMPTIEAAAGITTPSGSYTLQLTGPIVGYAQHVLFNPTTGQFSDLSSFRNGGDTANAP